MAEQGYVLDIDTKFLQNLEKADAALQRTIASSDATSKKFVSMLGSATSFKERVDQIYTSLSKLGGVKIDQGSGFAKVNTDARTSVDAVNLLTQNMKKLEAEYQVLQKATKKGGLKDIGMVAGKKELTNMNDLKAAVGLIKEIQKAGSYNGKPLTLVQTQGLNEQLSLYKRAIQELNMTDEQRLQRVVAAKNAELSQVKKNVTQIIAEEKRRVTEVGGAQTAEIRNALALSRTAKSAEELKAAYSALSQLRDKILPDTRQGQVQIQALERSMDKLAQKEKQLQSQLNAKINTSFKGSLDFASQAHSIKQLEQALKNLEIAKKRVNPDTKIGREQMDALNRKIDETKKKLNEVSGTATGISKSLAGLKRIISTVFAGNAMGGFIRNLVTVRGELEMQQKSLQVLLRSRAQADVLWKQTTDLALKSPFQVKQLVTATKQLAAYRVESHKLFGTTKMLADISAGLGVEMSRLILAFGQVKAAGFLRGTELRQFTEAGVNMLDELARYYTNIEGKTVTVSQVFERISKRMVSFQDVEAVLQNITSQGGLFYNMQEEQAETLRGQISNLKDSVQLMFNDIGQQSDGIMKAIVGFMRLLVENWEILKRILVTVGTFWGIYTIGVKTNTAALFSNTNATKGAMISMAGLRSILPSIALGFKTASNAAKTFLASIGPLGWALLALEAGMAIFKSLHADFTEINKDIGKLKDSAGVLNIRFFDAKSSGDLNAQKAALRDMLDFAERELLLTITPKIDLDSGIIDEDKLVDEVARVQSLIDAQIQLNRQLAEGVEEADSAFLVNGINKDVSQYSESANDYYNTLVDMRQRALGSLTNLNRELTEEESKMVTALNSMDKEVDQSTFSHFNELRTNSDIIVDAYKKVYSESDSYLRKIYNLPQKYSADFSELWNNEFEEAFSKINLDHIPVQERSVLLKAAIDDTAARNQWDVFTQYLAYNWANLNFGVNIDTNVDGDEKDDKDEQKEPKQPTGGGKPPKDKRWENAINAIKKYNDAYNKLLETNDALNAKRKADEYYFSEVESYAKKAGLAIQDYNITTTEGATAALNALREKSKYDDDKKKVGEIILGVKMDEDENIQEELFNKLEDQTEGIFSSYEISVELDKLHISKDATRDLFGVEHTSLDELRDKVMSMKGDFDALGKKGVEAYKKYLDKIDGLESKAQQERLKKYVEYTKQSLSELGKIRMDAYNEKADIGETFKLTESMAKNKWAISDTALEKLHKAGKDISYLLSISDEDVIANWGVTKTQIDAMREYVEILEQHKALALDAVSKREASDIAKYEWKSFEETEVFAQVFNDMENASDSLIQFAIDKLDEFKEAWKDLDVTEFEEYSKILEMYDKLKSTLALSSPGSLLSTSNDKLKNMMQGDEKVVFNSEEANEIASGIGAGAITEKDYDAFRTAMEIEVAYLEEKEREQKIIVSENESELRLVEQKFGIDSNEAKLAKVKLDLSKGQLSNTQSVKNTAAANLQIDKDRVNALKKQRENLGESLNQAQQLYDAFRGLAAVFADEDSLGLMFADTGMQMAQTVINTIMLQIQLKAATVAAGTFGAAMNAAMGVIGWIVMGVQLLTMALTAAFKAHDKSIQKQMDAEIEAVETLKGKYEELEKQLEKAYQASEIGRITREMNDNLQKQIDKTKELKALEEDKKKVDKDAVKGYDDEIKDLESQIAENIENTFSTLTDGILDNVLDAARSFVDAWHDAYEEAGDGMKGLEGNFKEMLLNMLKQQASMQLIAPYIADYKDWLKKYVDPNNGDDELTIDEARAWADQVRATFPEVDSLLSNLFEGAQSIFGGEYGELSGLEKGIQGMTEEQAEVLAAYWNSCRFMLSNIDTNLAAIASSVLGGPNNSNPVVEAIQAQTSVITEIKEMFESVIGRSGYTSGGSYIKTLEG